MAASWDHVHVNELFDLNRDSVARFLARWYGPPDQPDRVSATAECLPGPLRAWHTIAGRYSTPITFQNHMLPPEQIHEADRKLVFWRESQGVYEWGVDPTGDDPPVYERATAPGEPWHLSGVRLAAFLVSVAVFEAIMGAEHSVHFAVLTGVERDAELSGMRPLPMPGPTANSQLYAGDGTLAFATPDSVHDAPTTATTWWLWLATSDPTRLPTRTVRPA
jgi:hypothetical protein